MLTRSTRTTSQTTRCTSKDNDHRSSMVGGDSRHSSVDRRRANTADTTAENRVLSASERDALLRQLDVTCANIVRRQFAVIDGEHYFCMRRSKPRIKKQTIIRFLFVFLTMMSRTAQPALRRKSNETEPQSKNPERSSVN